MPLLQNSICISNGVVLHHQYTALCLMMQPPVLILFVKFAKSKFLPVEDDVYAYEYWNI